MEPTIVAIGGGGLGVTPENAAIDRYLLDLAGKERPRVILEPVF